MPPVAGCVPTYRWYLPARDWHFYTNDPGERPGGWNEEGVHFRLFPDGAPGTVTLYRLWRTDGGHFYTVAGPELDAVMSWGWRLEGPLGNVATAAQPGTVPLHRPLKWNGRHFYSTDKADGDRARFRNKGVIGYVVPAQAGCS